MSPHTLEDESGGHAVALAACSCKPIIPTSHALQDATEGRQRYCKEVRARHANWHADHSVKRLLCFIVE